MADPCDLKEFWALYKTRQRIFGVGASTSISAPCPFCAAADFWVYRVIDVRETITKETICASCLRGVAVLFVQEHEQSTTFEIVQTTGPDQPAWLQPQMRRLTEGERNHAG